MFSPGDRVTGFVQFRTAPAPGDYLLYDDIEAFELSAGGVVVTEMRNEEAWFLFDERGQVMFWDLTGYAEPSTDDDRYRSVSTYRDETFGGDAAYASWPGSGEEWPYSVARSELPGVWTLQDALEPATAVLWSVMGISAVVWRRWTRRRGRALECAPIACGPGEV